LGTHWSPSGRYIAASEGDYDTFHVLAAMYGPENCLIKNSTIADTCACGEIVGTGLSGCVGNNGIICNSCFNNNINFSYGIPNKYHTYTRGATNLSDNLSCNFGVGGTPPGMA